MNFFRYIFRFLYIRDWHTGVWELSARRMYWSLATAAVVLVGLFLVYRSQQPVVYEQAII